MDADLKSKVQTLLANEIAPALEMDGGLLEVLDVSGGVVQVRLNGACAGCPATIMTLVHGIEHELRQRIPEIEYLEAVP
jgi:Fe-S cluster biogenesis protein NfuA